MIVYQIIKGSERMKKNFFDFHKIESDEVCIGDIYIVGGNYNYHLVKKNAILIRMEYNKFVDVDYIKDERDCIFINDCLNNNIYDNIILQSINNDFYIGKMFLKNVRFYNELKNQTNDIFELKLIKK